MKNPRDREKSGAGSTRLKGKPECFGDVANVSNIKFRQKIMDDKQDKYFSSHGTAREGMWKGKEWK